MKYGPHSNDARSLSPFFVGLVGHRSLRDEEIPRIQNEFDDQIGLLLKRLKLTRIIVLTSLAEGADRIAHGSKYRDSISVCAVLPFSQKEYTKDFSSRQSAAQFKRAFSDCDYAITYPRATKKSRYVGKARNQGYRDCARWISDNSNLLIVLWDGKQSGKVGGTSDTLEYRLEDIASRPLIYSRGSGLLHILTSNGASDFKADCVCPGHSADSAEYLDYLSELERFNSRVISTQSTIADDQLKVYFKQFDESAVVLQREFRHRTILLLALGVLTLTFAAIQQITFAISWLAATGGALSVTLLFWWRLTRSRTKVAYETFRFVAEVLRIQIWWNETGVDRNILHEDIESHDVNDTVYLLLSNILMFSMIHDQDLHRPKTYSKSIKKKSEIIWVEEQISYLSGAQGRDGAILRTVKSAKRNLRFSIAALGFAALAQIYSTVMQVQSPIDKVSPTEIAIKILFTVSLAIAAAFAAFEEGLGNKEISSLYDLKLRRLSVAAAQLKRAKPNPDQRTVVTRVGMDSLAESLRWFQLKSEREIKPFRASS